MGGGPVERRGGSPVLPLDKPERTPGPAEGAFRVPPAQAVLEARLAARDGAEAAALVASAAGALACTLLALLRPGDHLVAAEGQDGARQAFLMEELSALGMAATVITVDDARGWRRALRGTTRVLLVPCPDAEDAMDDRLRAPRLLAREAGVALVAVVAERGGNPLAHGADVVVRALGGAGDETWPAVVCAPAPLADDVRLKARRWGLAPAAAMVTAVASALSPAGGPAW